MQFKIQKLLPLLRFLILNVVVVGLSFLDLLYIISTLDAREAALLVFSYFYLGDNPDRAAS